MSVFCKFPTKKKNFFHRTIKAFLSFGLGRSISRITKNFFGVGLFHFLGLESSILKAFNLEVRKFHFPKYKKNIFFKKLLEIFSEWHFFIFLFFELGLESGPGSPINRYFQYLIVSVSKMVLVGYLEVLLEWNCQLVNAPHHPQSP